MYLAKINITLKESVLDPQGQTVLRTLQGMSEQTVQDVRVGKYVEMKLQADSTESAQEIATRICDKLLVNSVIESYHLEIAKL
ncbi:MAG: phosphoribosylformylglycinamidine synthase subunit PurS [Leptospira sp.]|jgi:phosphoribosylformylglycinamidine synthase subunit PurS|nr:phosphoribosylformylglycinamidine synthase subunit PurS [Leptospira sp.]